MRKIFLMGLVIIFLSCSTYKRDKFEYRNNDKKVWINTFKSEVFYSCIKEGIKNDSLHKILENKDLFNIYDGFEINSTDFAREIGKKIILNMPKAYIKIDNDEEALLNKNFISYNCLNYYASKELDSIANIEYKKHLKGVNF
jgi:hypothetical protein